jgi:DNA repair protein RecO (recombination protein O)
MEVENRAIILKTTKYQDKNIIVKVYSLQHGIMSFFVQNVFSTSKKPSKIAYFQPLNIIEFELYSYKIGSLPKLKYVNNKYILQEIYTKIEKSSILIFLAELINFCIKEEEKNQAMFTFLEHKILELENQYHSNFHLIFLLEFTAFLGFYPKIEYQENYFFDKQNGTFTPHYNTNCFSENQSRFLAQFFENPNLILNTAQKNNLINLWIEYYQNHIDSQLKLKSLEVLKEIFAV